MQGRSSAIGALAGNKVSPSDGMSIEVDGPPGPCVATARARRERIEFRTTPEVRRLVDRAVEASDRQPHRLCGG